MPRFTSNRNFTFLIAGSFRRISMQTEAHLISSWQSAEPVVSMFIKSDSHEVIHTLQMQIIYLRKNALTFRLLMTDLSRYQNKPSQRKLNT